MSDDIQHRRGPTRIDPESIPHANECDDLGRGVWFVGYWSDGRAAVYDDGIHSVHLKPCNDGDEAWTVSYDESDESVEYERHEIPEDVSTPDVLRVPQPSIEHWVRSNADRFSALHPRYHWILEVTGDE